MEHNFPLFCTYLEKQFVNFAFCLLQISADVSAFTDNFKRRYFKFKQRNKTGKSIEILPNSFTNRDICAISSVSKSL